MPNLESERQVLVVIPAFNEQKSVGSTVRELRAVGRDYDILVVDDGSSDLTGALAEAAGAAVCRLPFNLGVGGAMRAGYRYALRHGYNVAVQVDADGQHDPKYIPRLIDRLSDADIVIGARFAGEGEYAARGPRRWAMWFLARTLSRLARTKLTDVTSGFRVTNSRAISVFAMHYPAEYLGDTVESLVIALRTGCHVVQEPVSMRVRRAGMASQSSFTASLYLIRAIVALGLALLRRWPSTLDGHLLDTS